MAHPTEAGLVALLERLKSAQRDLLLTAAKGQTMPSDSTVRKISELEGAIVATEALIEEGRGQR